MAKITSVERLRLQNKKLQAQVDAKRELLILEQERIRLAQQNQRLIKEIKRSPREKTARRIFSDFRRGVTIAGKRIGRGLVQAGRNLDQQQRQNQRKAKKLRKVIRTGKRTSRKRKIR